MSYIERLVYKNYLEEGSDGRRLLREEYYFDDVKLHRRLGPAVILTDRDTGEIIFQEWCERGKRHNPNGPAVIDMRNDERRMEWYLDGKLSRNDGPAIVVHDEQGRLVREGFYQAGKHHRVDGPAELQYDPDTGIAYTEMWKVNGQLHREGNLPAIIGRDCDTGEVIEELYYEHGKAIVPDGGNPDTPSP